MEYGIFTTCVALSCSTSYKIVLDAPTLVGLLTGAVAVDEWEAHLVTFFNEQPVDYIVEVMQKNNLSIDQLATVFSAMPSVLQGKNFKQFLVEHGAKPAP